MNTRIRLVGSCCALGLLVSACNITAIDSAHEATAPAVSSISFISPPDCEPWECGGNAPTLNGQPLGPIEQNGGSQGSLLAALHDAALHDDDGSEARQSQVRLTTVCDQGCTSTCDLVVANGEFECSREVAGELEVLAGPDLEDYRLMVEIAGIADNGDPVEYEIIVEDYDSASDEEPSAYTLTYRRRGSASMPRPLCTNLVDRSDSAGHGSEAQKAYLLTGIRVDPASKEIRQADGTFMIGCSSHALGKMARLAHSAGFGLADVERLQATLRMLIADYSGNGASHTVMGRFIWWLYEGVASHGPPADGNYMIESDWGPSGATCLSQPRLPQLVDSCDDWQLCSLSGPAGSTPTWRTFVPIDADDVVIPATEPPIRINFEPASAVGSAGASWLSDTGASVGDRGNGYTYGWNVDNQLAARKRDMHPDPQWDTIIHMVADSEDRSWEIELDRGWYMAHVGFGDPLHHGNTHHIVADGGCTEDGVPVSVVMANLTTANHLRAHSAMELVQVCNRRLQLSPYAPGTQSKLAFIELVQIREGQPAGGPVKINFQPADAPTFPESSPEAPEYLVDSGDAYDLRGNLQTYGWRSVPADGIGEPELADNPKIRDRDHGFAFDQRYDTLAYMQKYGDYLWELAVPNGLYAVFIMAGDPAPYPEDRTEEEQEQVFGFRVESTEVVAGAWSDANGIGHNARGTALVVAVADGALTIASGENAKNNKISFVHIQQIVPLPPPRLHVDDDYCDDSAVCDNNGHLWGKTAFSTISAALAAARENSEIFVYPGTYAETLEVSKSVRLRGQRGSDGSKPVIQAPQAPSPRELGELAFYSVVTISGDGAVSAELEGFAIRGPDTWTLPDRDRAWTFINGVFVYDAYAKIQDNTFEQMSDREDSDHRGAAIMIGNWHAEKSGRADILGNIVGDSANQGRNLLEWGIVVSGVGSQASVRDNQVYGDGARTSGQNAFEVSGEAHADFLRNIAKHAERGSDGTGGAGIFVADAAARVVVRCNTLESNHVGLEIQANNRCLDTVILDVMATHNTMADNHWNVRIDESGSDPRRIFATLAENNFLESRSGVGVNQTGYLAVIDASNNWWGSADGPGSALADDVMGLPESEYTPWATDRFELDCNPPGLEPFCAQN